MKNKTPIDQSSEDEIDLKKLFKLLINSKKLIIIVTLIITTLGAVYSFQMVPKYKSSALIEIGKYDTLDAQNILIESPSTLLQSLSVYFTYKSNYDLSMVSIEDKLVEIEIVESSIELSKKLLNEVIAYIEDKHSNLLQTLVNKLEYEIAILDDQMEYSDRAVLSQTEGENLRIANEIESLNNEIEYSNNILLSKNQEEKLRVANEIERVNNEMKFKQSELLSKNQDLKLRIANEIYILNNDLPNIDNKVKALNKVIMEDQSNLKLLQSNPDLFIQRTAQAPTMNQIIHSYKIQLLDLENKKLKLLKEIDHLENKLMLLETNNLKSDEIFKLSQDKINLELELKLLDTNNLESDNIFKLSQEKDTLNVLLNRLESNLKSDDIFKLSQEKNTLEIQLKLLGDNLKSDEIFKLSQKRNRLQADLNLLLKQNSTKTQLVGKIMTTKIGMQKKLIIFLSFLIGLFLSIGMVLIYNNSRAIKSY